MKTRGDLIYGLQPVREAIRAGARVREVYVHRASSRETQRLLEEARAAGARVFETQRRELDVRACTDGHQGIVAYVEAQDDMRDPLDVGAILDRARSAKEAPLVLLLDGVQDPQNLGAIIRTTHALGGHGVVIPKHRASPLTPAAIKASAGAAAHLPVARVTNIKHAMDELKDAGVWIAAAAMDGDPLDRARLDGPLAFVLGSEGQGLRPTVAEQCDLRVRIDLSRGFGSLNVSVAAGILMYEALRQRRTSS